MVLTPRYFALEIASYYIINSIKLNPILAYAWKVTCAG